MAIKHQRQNDSSSLQHRLDVVEVLVSISSHFLAVPASQIENEIPAVLEQVGRMVGAERVFCDLFKEGTWTVERIWRWRAPGSPPIKDNLIGLRLDNCAWAVGEYKKLGYIKVNSVAELPPEAKEERTLWERVGVKSIVTYPLSTAGNHLGMLGFASESEEKVWPENDLHLLSILRSILINAIVRFRMDTALFQSHKALEQKVVERTNELQQANVTLKQSLSLLQSILDNLPVGVIVTDISGRFVHVNRTGEDIWRGNSYSSDISDQAPQQIGWWAGTGQQIAPEEWNIARALSRGETSKEELIEIQCLDGSKKTILSSAVPLRDERGAITGALEVMNDVTDKIRLENALRNAERLASLGTLATGIAHEINNPLASILTIAHYIQALKDHPRAKEVLDSALADITSEAKRCGDIVKGILKFARNESAEKWLASLNDVVLKSVTICREYASSYGVRIITELNPVVPEVLLNTTQMEQVAVNLLRNAVEATSAISSVGRRPHEVVIKTFLKGQNWGGFVVEDTGPGLSQEDMRRIFDPFYTTRREGGGLGLGLSVCHGLITEHGGKIKASNSTLGGLSVEVLLPIPTEH